MTNQIRNPNDERTFIRFPLLFVLSLIATAACAWAAGSSLGLFFGGLFVVTFLTPAGVLQQKTLVAAALGFIVVMAPVAGVWLIAVFETEDTFWQWIEATMVLAVYALAIGGIALALARAKLPAVFAAALAILVGLAWLTWPVWLSGALVRAGFSGTVQHLVWLHPPLAINGILTGEPAWTERSLAYHLTDLNQDVPIRLLGKAGACLAVHGVLALMLWWVGFGGGASAFWMDSRKGTPQKNPG
ncbi:MAG: hypothetical protein ABSC42_17035 [Tepidisphaeraceae bacterium]|jgi:hypothetical protein